jgi:hypothetical protein
MIGYDNESFIFGPSGCNDIISAFSDHHPMRSRSSIEIISASIKQLTLAVSLLKVQSNRVLDDLAEMFIKRMPIIAQRFFGLAAAPAG